MPRFRRGSRGKIDANVSQVLESGQYVMGPMLKRFEAEFAAYTGKRHAIGVGNGTDPAERVVGVHVLPGVRDATGQIGGGVDRAAERTEAAQRHGGKAADEVGGAEDQRAGWKSSLEAMAAGARSP